MSARLPGRWAGLFAAAILAAGVPAAPRVASAEDVGGLDDAPLVRRQLLLRGGRHEAYVGLGMSLNDAFVRGWAPTPGYAFYLFNWFGVGADIHLNACGLFLGDCKTDLAQQVEDIPAELKAGELEDMSRLSFLVTPYATLVPISGKMGILGSQVVNWDVHLIVGGSLVISDNAGDGKAIDSGSTMSPVIGIGQRFFIDDSLAITVSLRDYIINRALNSAVPRDPDNEAAPAVEEEIENRFFLTVGVSFFFPTSVATTK